MEEKELREKIFTALGEASMCWNPTPTGVFDSTRAKRIGDELVDSLKSKEETLAGAIEEICEVWKHSNTPMAVVGLIAAIKAEIHGEWRRHTLPVLADNKGMRIKISRPRNQWAISVRFKGAKDNAPIQAFSADTYPEAEAKAREYLNGLPDKEGR